MAQPVQIAIINTIWEWSISMVLAPSSACSYHQSQISDAGMDLFDIVSSLNYSDTSRKLTSHQDPHELAERFADFFEDKIKIIRSNLDSEELIELSVRIEETCASSLSTFSEVSEDTVRKLTDSPPKFCPFDSMPTWLLKKSAVSLVPTITKIINLSLSIGVVPENFKIARVVPLLKKTGHWLQ